MNYKKDPVYRALNAQKPDKHKALAAAYAEMEAAPKAKARIPFYQARRVMAACLVVFFVVLIPVLVFRFTDMFNGKSSVPNSGYVDEDLRGAAPPNAPAKDYIDFNLPKSEIRNDTSNESFYGPILSYNTLYNGMQESLDVFIYSGAIPQPNKSITIENLEVTGYYTTEPANSLTLIKLYFSHDGIDYLIEIYCSGEDRLPFYLSKIK